MSTTELEPLYSAELSNDAYLMNDDFGLRTFKAKYKRYIAMDATRLAQGKTGAFVRIKKPHLLAFMGRGTGRFQGSAFVVFKGTASLYDALTDLNTGIRTSHTGTPVHQGFYYALDSVLVELRQFIGQLKGVSTIHCLGHSLGGALASLAGDWIKANTPAYSVKLYTFGSPRVGLETYAQKSTSRIHSDNIYRMYHQTDPVPMVPTWPFFHVPSPGPTYLVYSPVPAKPWEYHRMKHYLKSAKAAGSWKTIKNNRPQSYADRTVERWLESDSIASFGASSLELMNAALLYVVKKVLHTAGIGVTLTGASTFTLLDRLAVFMSKAKELSTDLGKWVFYLVRKMASMVGITVKEGAGLTVSFMRAVFLRLHNRISQMIWHAGQDS